MKETSLSGKFLNLVVLTCLLAIFYAEALFLRSFAPFHAPLRSLRTCVCAHLRAFTCFCVHPRSERPRFETSELLGSSYRGWCRRGWKELSFFLVYLFFFSVFFLRFFLRFALFWGICFASPTPHTRQNCEQNMAPKLPNLPCFEASWGHSLSRCLFIFLPCMWGAGVTSVFLSFPCSKAVSRNMGNLAPTPSAPTPFETSRINMKRKAP